MSSSRYTLNTNVVSKIITTYNNVLVPIYQGILSGISGSGIPIFCRSRTNHYRLQFLPWDDLRDRVFARISIWKIDTGKHSWRSNLFLMRFVSKSWKVRHYATKKRIEIS